MRTEFGWYHVHHVPCFAWDFNLEETVLEQLQKIQQAAAAAVRAAGSEAALDQARQTYLGKKGELTLVLKGLGGMDADARREMGMAANAVKEAIAQEIEQRQAELIAQASVVEGALDVTLPGAKPAAGGLHPITQMCYDLNDAFLSLGFEVFEEDDITSERYAFDNLNFPAEHPARDSMDTYWLKGSEDKSGAQRLCLRPQFIPVGRCNGDPAGRAPKGKRILARRVIVALDHDRIEGRHPRQRQEVLKFPNDCREHPCKFFPDFHYVPPYAAVYSMISKLFCAVAAAPTSIVSMSGNL